MGYFDAMEGNFYRAAPRKKRLKKIVGNLLRNRKRVLILLGAIVLSAYVMFDNKGVVKRIRLELQQREMAAKVEAANAETKQLQAQLKALEGDKKTIEKIAREKYGMAREGETIYKVKKN
jgi:cell division protein FtsB